MVQEHLEICTCFAYRNVNIVAVTLEGSGVVISTFQECVQLALFMLVASAAAVMVRNAI